MIKIMEIYRTYKIGEERIHALNGVSLEIQDGEFVSIVGPSGSGKSTLMHLIGGLDKPDKGKIEVDGTNIKKINDIDLAKFRNRNVGFVFQSFNLQPTLTALENVTLPLIFAGVSHKERVERATKALIRVGLEDRINHKPTELSGGQKQRVSVARAIINNPKILLADEPTGNLDTKTGAEIVKLLDTLNEESKMTVIVVTHDIGIANAGDKVITIIDGKIVNNSKGGGRLLRSSYMR